MAGDDVFYETVIVPCPIAGYNDVDDDGPKFWIERPDEWYGVHSAIYEEALRVWRDERGVETNAFLKFAVSVSLLDDYRLPGLEGPQKAWDLNLLPMSVMAWVVHEIYADYKSCETVPKNYFPVSRRRRQGPAKQDGGTQTNT